MSNPRRANGAKRDRLIARIKREERDCHLCGGPVDVRLPPRLPGSPEVDEILPVTYGGSPLDRANCRLSHRWCNRRRWHHPVAPWRARLTADPPLFGTDGSLIREGARDEARRLEPVASRSWL